ncbi:replication protein, partial [Escherichia coli EC1846]
MMPFARYFCIFIN